jgi:alkylation response protein AidB-like acyl-CoA dehydrogenase
MIADLLTSTEEDELSASLRGLLAARCPSTRVLAMYDGDSGLAGDLWPALGIDMGLAGLLVPEQHGGAGASARDAAIVLEELGRSLAPVPFLTSSVMAVAALQAAQAADSLRQIAGGSLTCALAVPLGTCVTTFAPTATLDDDGLVHGRIGRVAGTEGSGLLLVPASDPSGGLVLALVDTAAAACEPLASLDMSRPLANLRFAGSPAIVVTQGDSAADAIRAALLLGAALLASEQVGIAQWCLDTTVGYLLERRQFGRLIGSYQAVKHRAADLFIEVETARAVARYAAAAWADGSEDRFVASAVAQAYCSDVAVHAAQECVQLHGGIGFTWEHPAHLYLKRAKADQVALGTPGDHRAILAGLIDLSM